MTDQLFLSIWLEVARRNTGLREFERMLRFFPFSQREQPQTIVTIHAVSATEPPVLQRPFNGPADIGEIFEVLQNYTGDDIAYEVDGWWDLWQSVDGDWRLVPTHVLLAWFGPAFDNGTEQAMEEQEDLRIEFGVDTHFLPQTEAEGGARLIESNIKSLLRLVHELDSTLPVRKRQLQTESGENFAVRLQTLLTSEGQPS